MGVNGSLGFCPSGERREKPERERERGERREKPMRKRGERGERREKALK